MAIRAVLAAIAIGGAVSSLTSACGGSTEQPGGTSTPAASPSVALPSIPPSPTPVVSAENLDPSTYESLSPRNFALIVKDPDSNKGRKIIVSGVVTQFDTATGQSDFRANTGANPDDVAENQINTVVSAPDPKILANVVAQDQVTMWCQVQGTDTYNDAEGGEMTVPMFSVYIIKDNGSLNPDQQTPTGTPGQ